MLTGRGARAEPWRNLLRFRVMRRTPPIVLPAALLVAACSAPARTEAPVAAAPAPAPAPSPTTAPPAPALRPKAPPVAEPRPVTDTYHGVAVVDPYRWLENDDAPEVKAWSDGQNAYARGVLDALPDLPAVRDRLRAVLTAPVVRHGQLRAAGGKLFAMRLQPPQEQPQLVVIDDLANPGAARVVLDPAALAGGGANAIDWYEPSPDGSVVAVSLSQGGSEAGDLHFVRLDGSEVEPPLPGVQRGTAGGAAAWSADGKSIFYTRYPAAGERPEEERSFYQQLYQHVLGTPAAQDRYELGRGLPKVAEIQLEGDPATGRLLATIQDGDSGVFRHYLRDRTGGWRQLSDWGDQVVAAVFGADDDLYLVSRAGAPRGQVLRLRLGARSLREAKVLIPQGKDTLVTDFYDETSLILAGGRLHAIYQTGGPSQLRAFGLDGRPVRGQPTAAPVSAVGGLAGHGDDVLFEVASYTTPSAWYRYGAPRDAAPSRKPAPPTTTEVPGLDGKPPVDLSGFEVIREMAISADKTQVPLNIVWPKGAPRDGSRACVVTGYGGYRANEEPGFPASLTPLLERGVCLVDVNLRGGGEFGEEWHQQGMLTRKQNVFDDFAAALRHLSERGYSAPARLAIKGGSNGGLLMGALVTQHPELVRAVWSSVGIYDSLRNELTANGTFNVPEYGSVKDEAQFKALYAYSPYHHVKAGTAYPAILLTTGANDPRVAPWHSRKMTAALQAATASGLPVLLRTSESAGHGPGTRLSEWVDLVAAGETFLLSQIGGAK